MAPPLQVGDLIFRGRHIIGETNYEMIVSGLCPDPPLVGEAGKERGSFPDNRVIRVVPSRAARAQAPSVLSLDFTPAPLGGIKFLVKLFELIRRHVVTVTVYPDGIVKSFNIFKHESVGMFEIQDLEAVQPLTFDDRVKGLNTGIVVNHKGAFYDIL